MGLFDALKEKLGLQPRIVYLQAPKVPARVPIQAVPVSNDSLAATEAQAPVPVPTPISLEKKPADVEDIPTRFKFGMQQVTVAVHHASEVPARFLSSLVGGR